MMPTFRSHENGTPHPITPPSGASRRTFDRARAENMHRERLAMETEGQKVEKLLEQYKRLGVLIGNKPHDKMTKERVKRAHIGNQLRNMGFDHEIDHINSAFEKAKERGKLGDVAVSWVDAGIALQPGLSAKGYAYIQAARGPNDKKIWVSAFKRRKEKIMGVEVELPYRDWARPMTDAEFKKFAEEHDVDVRKA